MSSDWPRAKVGDLQAAGVLLVEDGNHGENRPRSEEFGTSGTCFIRAADMSDGRVLFDSAECINSVARTRIRKGIGQPGDVLLSHKGTVGKVALVPGDCPEFVCSPQTTFWRVLDHAVLDRGYLFAYLQSRDFKDQLASRKGETDMADYVSLTAQRQLTVPLPALEVQKSIGSYEKALFDRIALLRETNATLEAITQALFKSWFVDFDPVRAKSQGLPPAGMDEATAALFPDGFEASTLGPVPRDWRVGAVSDYARMHRGSVSPGANADAVFEHFSLPAFDSGQMPVREKGAEIKSNKTPVTPNAVLLSKLNPHIPRVWLPVDPGAHAVCSTEFLVFIPAAGASREFVYCSFTASAFQARLRQLVTGTSNSHQRVKPNGVLESSAVVPPPPLLETFASVTRPILAEVGKNRLQSQTLATLRDTLLPRLISGQLRLPEAIAEVEDVA